jgi:hypothetical protein
MADRDHRRFTTKNSRPGLPTIFSADDASSAQSESSSVAISDASSIKSSEYAASLISDCMSATSSECSDEFYNSDGDTTNDDSTMVSDLPEIEVAARSTKHPRSKRTEIIEGDEEGRECKPINLTDMKTGNAFAQDQAKGNDTRVNATVGEIHGRDQAKLYGIHYLSSFDVASTHRGLSVVEPIGKHQASEAFHRVIPSTIPSDSGRDDFSSIAAVSLKLPRFSASSNDLKLPRFSARSNDYWHRAGDVRPDRQTRAPSDQEQAHSTKAPCCLGKKSDLEVFFIAIISVSLIILVVLLAIVLAK